MGALKLKAYTALPSIIEVGLHMSQEADRHNDRNVKAVHKFFFNC